MKKIATLIFGIAAVAILSIALLLFPGYAQESFFWKRVLWLIFLTFLNWGAATFIFFTINSPKKLTIFGVLPTVSSIIFFYSLLSVAILTVEILKWFSLSSFSYLAIQIGLGALTAILLLFIFLSATGAESNTSDASLWTKDALVRMIQEAQDIIAPEHTHNIKLLIERIKYAVPPIDKLNSAEDYKKLMEMAQALHKSTENIKTKAIIEEMMHIAEHC